MQEYTFIKDHSFSANFLKKNFYKLRYSLGNSNVDYWIVLPNYVKEFSTMENKLKSLDISLIGQYTSSNDFFFDVEVFYEHLKFDINTADWLMRKLSKLNETILFKDDFQDKSTGIYADVLSLKEISTGDQFISRITAKKNFDYENGGANYVGVRVTCREQNYNELADFALHTVYNWDFENKGDWQLAERIVPYNIKMKEMLSFYIFESWRILGEENEALNHLIIRQEANDQNAGIINIFETEAPKNGNVEELFDSFINRVEIPEKKISKPENISNAIKNPKILTVWMADGILKNTTEQFKTYASLFLIQTEHTFYYVESLGSSANYENYNWEINKRQVEMFIESLNNQSFEQDNNKMVAPKQIETNENVENEEKRKNNFGTKSIFFN